ncbi:hypothetical protein ACI8AG_00495 [Blastococcus sp. SYSU DS0552]
MCIDKLATSPTARSAYLGFTAFGALWGTWGAALPAVRDATGVGEAQLGAALLCIGAGALPAMLLAGRAVDRFGGRVAGIALVLMAASGVAVATAAADLRSLAALLLLLGATSGAADVGVNTVAGATERAAGRPVLTRAHGVFSTAVVAGALVTGGLEAAGTPVGVAFALVVLVALVAARSLWTVRLTPAAGSSPPDAPAAGRAPSWALPLVGTGLVGALAFAVENAHQSWSAVFLADEISVAGGLTAAAPAVFAGVSALTRFAAGASGRLPPAPVLTGGAVAAAAGTLLLARSTTPVPALAGLALAAAGTSVLFPTLLREALRNIRPELRGRATSAVAATAYLGFVLGPVYVGALAGAAGLRTAVLGVAALAAVTAVLAWPVARWGGKSVARRTPG